ncbi:Reverse transcriptase domain [Cinara cedri]|uniref:Reverse transcriptase domain n=1 Tax=Cinara cedri TaxID=506608 RepID=A0A5E4N6B4_9HEMI|nr:Reverse transcriptase domain [Cinara cedri]
MSSSYRPLCLLDTTDKSFEKIIVRRLNEHLGDKLDDAQYGFRKKRSTTNAIRRLQAKVRDLNARGHLVGMLALYEQNAFNSVPCGCILDALVDFNMPQYLVDIVASYLSCRRVKFDIRGSEEDFTVERSVPQGSVLGPCLWNVLYDGLLRQRLPENVEILAFANDVAVIATAEHNSSLPSLLESAYMVVGKWMSENGLTLTK